MKHRALLFTAFVATFVLLPSAFAQGPLTPPGAPAPLFKTLTEVEPRIAVATLTGDATAQFVIAQPGSYYLTGNVTGAVAKAAIAIAADNVSLDLRGHALLGVAGATRGIEVRSARNQISIGNGSIRGFEGGGVVALNAVTNARVDSLTIACPGGGIVFNNFVPDNVLVTGCTVSGATNGLGIILLGRGTVERCLVTGLTGPGSVLGIHASVVTACDVSTLRGSGTIGVQGIVGSTVRDCRVIAMANLGTGAAQGINAGVVTGCNVIAITTTSGSAFGVVGSTVTQSRISSVSVTNGTATCMGINAGTAADCFVSNIGVVSAAGKPSGIVGSLISGCTVANVGGVNSGDTPVGISGDKVEECYVSFVGASGSAVTAVGIDALRSVTHCLVRSVAGGTATTDSTIGIIAPQVDHCEVSTISHQGSGTGVAGIDGQHVFHSQVTLVSAASSADAFGIRNGKQVGNCTVESISNSGTGRAIGVKTAQDGRIEQVVVSSSGGLHTGIEVGSAQTVIGCTISQATNAISASGTKNIIDGNNITGTNTTGILVHNGLLNAQALVIRNQVRNCATNFTLNAPCQLGPVVSAAGNIVSTSPWANFTD